jgi:hypothetical protein
MLRKIVMDLVTIDADGIVENATGDLEDVALTLIQTAPPDHLAHMMAFVASASIAAADFEVNGLDADGNTIQETVTGVTTSPVQTVNYYSSITSIIGRSADADIGAETLDVGWVDEAVSATIPLNWRRGMGFAIAQEENGTLEVDVQLSMEDPGKFASQELVPWRLWDTQLDDFLDNERFLIGAGYVAARVKINSYSTGADVTVYIVEPEGT